MAGNDEIFPSSTGRYEVTVSESGYHSTVNITVHNLTERDQGVIPLFFFTCCKRRVHSLIWVDLRGKADLVNFSYQVTNENTEHFLQLRCEATGYPRSLTIKVHGEKNVVAHKLFNTRNYQPTMELKTQITEQLCSLHKSYVCEVTDFEGNIRTRILHLSDPTCPLRLLDLESNNSVINTNVNDTAIFKFNVISSANLTVINDSSIADVNITKCVSNNCFNVTISWTSIQELDFKSNTIILAAAKHSLHYLKVFFSFKLKDLPQLCYNLDPNPIYTIYTRPSANLTVNFCLKSGVDIQHQHKMEVYVDNQRLSDKDIQVTKYNSRYQYGLDIVFHNQTIETTLPIEIRVYNLTLKCKVNIIATESCNNEIRNRPIQARFDQPLTIQFCVVSSSPLHDYIGINGHVIKLNTSHVSSLNRYVGVRRSGDDTYNVTIQLSPADVDGVQVFEVLVKNVEREAMPFTFRVTLLRENKTSIGPTHTSIPSATTSSLSDPDNSTPGPTSSDKGTTSPQSIKTTSSGVTVFLIIGAAAAVVLTTIIIIVVVVCRKKVKKFLESNFSSLQQQTNLIRSNNDYSVQTFDAKTGQLKNDCSKFLIDRPATLQSSDLEENNIYINAPERSLNSKGLNYITIDHTNSRDSLSTNRSSHSQDHVIYVKLDFQKMAKKEKKKSKH
ncbi:uncharacterized protein LOC131941090 [Physella acuta]|uniref:uncharacterized protein LOC131941090 n=1 Tax=Physella acuta TaxID=109671 RepID=UPI0027DD7535|nr:uncharacterized protein LOC131941090 [Physella acuta]